MGRRRRRKRRRWKERRDFMVGLVFREDKQGEREEERMTENESREGGRMNKERKTK
jgi:hypothetical protein